MPPVDTLYILPHSHTDIGFTHDQPIVWELHERFIDQALDLIEAETAAGADPASHFRWTVETTAVLARWLRHAPPAQVDRLVRAERAGWLEVLGMFVNITPLYDLTQLVESLGVLPRLRAEYGLTIDTAMNCDVNGENWPLVEVLLDAGITRFHMAINPGYGGAPEPRPNLFHWQGPSGRALLTYNGWHYAHGMDFGLGDATFDRFEAWWPRVERWLADNHYPLTSLMVQAIHIFGDNAPPARAYSEFARRWNALGRAPRLALATPRQWWASVAAQPATFPTWRGDWTDYWNFGSGSSAHELAVHRASRTRLLTADALFAAGQALPPAAPGRAWAGQSFARYRAKAWQALNLWAEHTWGADIGVEAPELEDSLSQHAHKRAYAYQARSLSLLLQRDALADLAQHVARQSPADVLLFNPLPWPRTLSGRIDSNSATPRGDPADTTSGRHFQGHSAAPTGLNAGRVPAPRSVSNNWGDELPPTPVPAFGYVTVPRSAIQHVSLTPSGAEHAIENDRFRATFDAERGGVLSLFDKQLRWEWVDAGAGWPLNGFAHETLAAPDDPNPREQQYKTDWAATLHSPPGWQADWAAARTGPSAVLSHHVYRSALGVAVEQQLAHPAVRHLATRVFLPAQGDYVDCEAEWDMGAGDYPEATYLLFPFNLPGATARLNVGGVPIIPGVDQLPGVCRDYFTVQDWLDFNDGQRGVVVGLPENPLVQLGDFHYAHHQADFHLERALLLGWVTNNYWMTNFQASQPGRVHARYRLWPYAGPFDEARAHRQGAEAAHSRLLAQPLGEPPAPGPAWPSQGSLLALPADPILTLHLSAAPTPGALTLKLWNASDQPQEAVIGSGLLNLRAAHRCDLFGHPQTELSVIDGTVRLQLLPRRVSVVQLQT